MLQHSGEHGVREQPNIFGKHAEHESVDEMGDCFRGVSAGTKPLRETGKLLCSFFREYLAGLTGLQPFRITEDPLELLTLIGLVQIIKCNVEDNLDCIGPVRMNTKSLHVADNEKRRIFQGDGILLQLSIGSFEVLMLALILPTEVPTFPDICPSIATGQFGGAALEAIPFTIGVSLCRRWLF
jgi:hypothetical protein